MSDTDEGLNIRSYMDGDRVRSHYTATLTGYSANEIGQIMGCMIKTANAFALEIRDAIKDHSADAAEDFDNGMAEGLGSNEVRSNITIALRAVKLRKKRL